MPPTAELLLDPLEAGDMQRLADLSRRRCGSRLCGLSVRRPPQAKGCGLPIRFTEPSATHRSTVDRCQVAAASWSELAAAEKDLKARR